MTESVTIGAMVFEASTVEPDCATWRCGPYLLKRFYDARVGSSIPAPWIAFADDRWCGELASTPVGALLTLRAVVRDRQNQLRALVDGIQTEKPADQPSLVTTRERDYYRDVLESLQRKIDKALTAPEG